MMMVMLMMKLFCYFALLTYVFINFGHVTVIEVHVDDNLRIYILKFFKIK